jgi:hypothetical protein
VASPGYRFTLQPLDAPPDPQHLRQVVDQTGSDDLLLFAGDYPHLHDADPERTLFPALPAALAQQIRSENARAFYRFPSRKERSHGGHRRYLRSVRPGGRRHKHRPHQ